MTSDSSDSNETTAPSGRRLSILGIEQRLLAAVRATLPPGSKLIVGFSGGPDSLALAFALARIRDRATIEPVLVHVDHGLRSSSTKEAAHAVALAAEIGLPIEVVTLHHDSRKRHSGVGVEEGARRERYLALAAAAERQGTRVISVAHHQDDQAETVLLHVFRGSGLTGAAGMAERSEIVIPWWTHDAVAPSFVIWRPFLNESKIEIDRYVAPIGLRANQDESNHDPSFTRNAVRRTVLPAIDAIQPSGRAALARFARLAADDDEALAAWASGIASRAVAGPFLDSSGAFRDAPIAIRRRVVRSWVSSRHPDLELTAERVDGLLVLAASGNEIAEIELGDEIHGAFVGERLAIGTKAALDHLAWSLHPDLPRGTFDVRSVQLETALSDAVGVRRWTKLPAAWVNHTARVRPVLPGDRFLANGTRVDKWLSRQRVPVRIRSHVRAFASDAGVLWVPGLSNPEVKTAESDGDSVLLIWSNEEMDEGGAAQRRRR